MAASEVRVSDCCELTTIDQLRELPALAAERWDTIGHPNPSERSARPGGRGDPAAPADLAAFDTLRTDEKGWLFRLAQCVRTVLETMRDADYWDAPEVAEKPTWASECDWLIATADWWQDDQWCIEYVADEVSLTWGHLRREVRTPQPHRLVCPDCLASATVDNGWLTCTEGHEQRVDKLADRMQDRPAVATTEIAAEFGVSPDRIYKWHERGRIKPVLTVGRAHLWRPWDVFTTLYPQLAKDLADRPREDVS